MKVHAGVGNVVTVPLREQGGKGRGVAVAVVLQCQVVDGDAPECQNGISRRRIERKGEGTMNFQRLQS